MSDVPWQPSLFGATSADFDRSFARSERAWSTHAVSSSHAPGWVTSSDALFAEVLRTRTWAQRTRWLWEQERLEPRLTAPWQLAAGEPLEPHVLEEMRQALGARYGVTFDSAGFNLYRDGRDSVAWHGDKIRREIREPVVVLVSLGDPRRFLLRPRAGGKSRAWLLGRGDLFVTGGRTQRTWLHLSLIHI